MNYNTVNRFALIRDINLQDMNQDSRGKQNDIMELIDMKLNLIKLISS